MSNRNFVLLIIVLVIVIMAVFGFLYLRKGTTPVDVISDGTNFLAQFNPFSSNPSTTPGDETPGPDTNGDGIISEEELAVVKLKKVSSMPVAGFTSFLKERLKDVPIVPPPIPVEGEAPVKPKKVKPAPPATEFALALRYVERATGNIYQTFVDKIEERRFSETVIPKIYDAYFGNKGQSVVMRHLKSDEKTIETFAGALPKEKLGEDVVSYEIKGSFLVDGIQDLSLSPDTSKIFYLSNLGDSAIGTILNLSASLPAQAGKKTVAFNSVFTEWNAFWGTNKTITVTTKPSGNTLGHMYVIDTDKKNLVWMLGNINGLTTLMSPNGKSVLVGNNNLSLYVYNTDTKTYTELGVRTLPEKCVWGKKSDFVYCAVPTFIEAGLYPDDWYRGEISFSDQIWKISILNGSTDIIADPFLQIGGEEIDGIKLALSESEKYLFFVNKKDSFLWQLEL